MNAAGIERLANSDPTYAACSQWPPPLSKPPMSQRCPPHSGVHPQIDENRGPVPAAPSIVAATTCPSESDRHAGTLCAFYRPIPTASPMATLTSRCASREPLWPDRPPTYPTTQFQRRSRGLQAPPSWSYPGARSGTRQLGSPTTRRGRRGAGGAGAFASGPRSAEGWDHQSFSRVPKRDSPLLHQAGSGFPTPARRTISSARVLGDGRLENAVPDSSRTPYPIARASSAKWTLAMHAASEFTRSSHPAPPTVSRWVIGHESQRGFDAAAV